MIVTQFGDRLAAVEVHGTTFCNASNVQYLADCSLRCSVDDNWALQ